MGTTGGEYGYMEDVEHLDNEVGIHINSLYINMFTDDQSEYEKIEALSKIFSLPKEEIKKHLPKPEERNKTKTANTKPKIEKKSKEKEYTRIDFYKKNFSLEQLKGYFRTLYIMNKGILTDSMFDLKKVINMKKEELIQKNGKKIYSIFKKVSNLENWNKFNLDFSRKLENKKINHDIIKKNIPNYKEVNGVYAIFDGENCLYIGKGRPIWSRIKSHYHSSQRPEPPKAIEWSDFFSQYRKELTIYWYQIDFSSDKKINDKVSETVEIILKSVYEPKFNR